MEKMQSFCFLIGGYDLEMVTITNILREYAPEIKMYDNELRWGAKLSSYASVFNDNCIFIAIELEKDIQPPPGYIEINHHNEESNAPSSLEQVLQFLKDQFAIEIPYKRNFQLIVANDTAHIAGMKNIGASPEEIAHIRSLDRKAQGITKKDEKLGRKSVKKNKKVKQKITIIKSLTPRFATITDRLYPCDRILIYTADELNYYGEGAKLLAESFDELVKENKAYYGGMGEGYFGLTKDGIQSLGGIKRVRKKVLKILTQNINYNKTDDNESCRNEEILPADKPLYSYHIFIFPFKWEHKSITGKTFSERFDLTKIKPWDNSDWINLPKPIRAEYATELYNEKNFFYEFVHPVLFDDEKWKDDPVVLHYERKEAYDNRKLVYEIDVIANPGNPYRLNLKSIGLNLYSTGTGSLVFYLENNDYPGLDNILRINQYGRRILPPFFDLKTGVLKTKQYELANHIAITGLNGNEQRYFEDFSSYTDKTDWKPARFIESLMADFNENLHIEPVTDDRMHVLCRYENDKMSRIVKGKWLNNDGFKNDWYRFLFVDGGKYPMCQNEKMKDKLIKAHTYTRWTNWGSIHGISRYSFVYLTPKNPNDFLKTHFRTIYARMVELTLIQRASILKFSEEVTELSKLKQEGTKSMTEKISGLYKEYIRFVNQVYFREVTAQEQGIELYNLMQEKMKIAEQVKDLDREIEELHNYANLLEQKEQEQRITKITVLGAVFLPATFLVGLFGINTLPEVKDLPTMLINGKPYWPFWNSLMLILLFTAILIVLIDWIGKFGIVFRKKKSNNDKPDL